MKKHVLIFLCFLMALSHSFAQTNTVTGRVTDENGNPLAGATVTASGTARNAITNNSGNFTINVPASARQLTVTFIGYTTQSVAIGNQTNIIIRLVAGSSSLTDVVVTGYSNVRKTEYSGAATKVTADKINFVPSASFDQILQGRAPGLLVTAGSGQPGAAARVQIRGQSSITGGNDPLYVLDGVPIEAGVFQSLNPNDFESVDVLRDAVATAQYGNRGSGGVIVITSKKGRAGKPVLSYNGQYGVTEPGKQYFDMMNSSELLQFQENLGTLLPNGLPGWVYSAKNPSNANISPAAQARNAAILDSLRGINTNWADVFQRHGNFSSHDVNLSGGSGGTRFYLSGGYYDEQGIGLRSDLTRYTVRANIDHRSDKLTVGFNSTVGYTKRNFIESENGIALANPFAASYLGLPYQKLFNDNGTVAVGPGKVGPNAYDRVSSTTQYSGQVKANVSANINYNIVKHVYIGGSAGLDYRQTTAERSNLPNTYSTNNSSFPVGPAAGSSAGGGSYGTGLDHFSELITRVTAAYRNVFNVKHDVDISAISEYTHDNAGGFSYTGFGINPKLLNTPAGITPGTNTNNLIPTVSGNKSQRSLYAAMVLARYTYEGKYTLNASFRRDGSSQLAPDKRYQNFYAVGGTWNVLKENFAQGWNKVSDLRLRVSYGTSASADNFPSGYYGYLATYGSGSYAGLQSVIPNNIGNADLTWEKVGQLNLGLDFAFFNSRLRGTVDLYDKKSTRNLVTQTLPLTGYTQTVNAATVSNKGVELTLSGDVVKTRDFSFTVGGNISYNKNRVTNLGQVNEFEQGTEIIRVGLPLGSHYIVKWAGVDAATGAPLYYTKDGKLTTTYSDNDRVAEFGTYNAPWIGGFNANVSFKGFSIDAFFSFQKGFSRFNNQDYFQLNHAFALQGFNLREEMLTMWQKPGDVTNIQSPLYQREFVSKDIQDASYLRFRNLTASYTLPISLFGNQKYISNIRIYGQAENLYTWTKWVGFDPEDNDNIAAYEYPLPRTFTAGINVTFK